MMNNSQWFTLAQFIYHRLPVADHVKLGIRQRVTPILRALINRSGKQQLLKSITAGIKNGGAASPWSGPDEEALARLFRDISLQCILHGPVSHIITLPFLGTGGAELVALNLAQVIRQQNPDRVVLIVITDRPILSDRVVIPKGVAVVRLDDYLLTNSAEGKRRFLLRGLVKAIRPLVFHNINSEVAWKLIIEEGECLRQLTQLFGSIFAFQFLPDGIRKIGYAAYFLRPALPYLTGLFSDNQRFTGDAIREYALDQTSQQKLRVIYNPCRILDEPITNQTRQAIRDFAARSPNRRLHVLWAGRLDAEKRIDLLIDIVSSCNFAEFEIFGQRVVDSEVVLPELPELPELPNLTFRGPFSCPQELIADGNFDAFIFTSRWEGLPNILLEIGALGIPVIAPTVGGIGELINEKTGFPLVERPAAMDYVSALHQIAIHPEEAAQRAESLLKLIESRHTWSTFVESVKEIPAYLAVADELPHKKRLAVHSLPRVSIIIPCYNQGRYLYESVSSVLLAYSGSLEIIIVDDGSTDPKTSHYLKEVVLLSDCVRILRQPNLGLSGARNSGIEAATGDYIQFLDADDLLVPGKLDAQIAHLTVAQDLDISICNFLLCDETRVFFTKPDEAIARFDLSLKDFLYRWERGFAIPIHCAVFSSSIFTDIRFDINARAKEDWLFWCSVALRGRRMAYLDGHYAIYRQHADSMRRSYVKMGKSWLNTAIKIDSTLKEKEPLFFESALVWFEQCYRGNPKYRQEIAELQDTVASSLTPLSSVTNTSPDLVDVDRLIARLAFLKDSVTSLLFTIVIPIYNHYEYLEECLTSLADQCVADIEVICIDDASPDLRVKKLMQSLQGMLSRLYIKIHDTNCGIAASLNEAVEQARGKYIVFLDCDDALPPAALGRVKDEIDRHPDMDYLFTDRWDVNESGTVLRVARYGGYENLRPSEPINIRNDLLDGMIASHLKVIRRGAYLAAGGYDVIYSGVQDWELALKIAETGSLVYLPIPLYRHRIHSASVTQSARVEQFRKTNMLRRRFLQRWLAPSEYQQPERVVLQELILGKKVGIFQMFNGKRDLPSLADLKACHTLGHPCIFDLRGAMNVVPINFVREYNSYFDLILWDDPATAAALIGYLWGDLLWRC